MKPFTKHPWAVAASIVGALAAVLAAGCGGEPFDPARIDQIADQLGLGSAVSVVAGEVVTSEADKASGSPATADTQVASASDSTASPQAQTATDREGAAGNTENVVFSDATVGPPEEVHAADGEEALADGDGITGGDAPAGDDEGVADDAEEQPAESPENGAPSINGVYVLSLEGHSESDLEPYLNNPDVDGFSLRAGWAEVEPLEGSYDWSLFDAVIPYAADHGKKIMLRIIPGVRAPEWVYEAGAARFDFVDDNPEHPTYGQVVSMPLPWDPVFLEKWFDLVAVFGARYADDPAVTIVAITGPATGGEMHLGDKNNPDRWHALGYSNELLIATWELTVDAFVAAFPHQHGSVAIANPVWFDNPHEVRETVGAYCAQVGGGVQGNWLSAATLPESPLYQQVASQAAITPVGFQMLCSAQQERFGGPLSTAIDLGLDAGASFLEFYRPDITAFPDDIAFAHQQLNLTAVE